MLTPLQEKILQYITREIASNGHAPTLSEIGAAVGIRSRGTVHRYVQALVDKGHLQHSPRGWRGLRLAGEAPARGVRLPLIGRIAAGRPIEAIPDQQELDLAGLFAGANRYVLEVCGDSMAGIGILDGDLVVIEQRDSADDGQIVVALIDGNEATLKRLHHHPDGEIELRPENPSFRPLRYAAGRVRVQGVLVGQLRRYD